MKIAYSSKCSVFFCVVFLLCIVPISAQTCESSNFTSPKFQSNLNIVLNNLVNNTSSSKGFNTSVSGQSPYTIYGLLQCRGDTTVQECLSCSEEANTTIRKSCGNATGGRSLQDKCFIRYQTYSFFGKLDLNFPMVYYNLQKVTNQPGVFSTAVRELFTNLSDEALRFPIRYASGSTVTSTFYKINSLVQCWRDLTSAEDCKMCLAYAIRSLLGVTLTDNGTFVGGVTSSGSCIARYEIYEFFNAAPPPPSPLQLPSPPPIQQSPLSSPTPDSKHISFLIS
jgi:hypothetical protein